MFNEESFVARAVALGSSESDARAIAARMLSSKKSDSIQEELTTADAFQDQQQSTPESMANADLFGESTTSASPQKTAIVKVPSRRGRKPVDFKSKEPDQRELDLFELSLDIEKQNAKESGDLGFLATAMVYASLPHSDVKEGIFKRRNGTISLTIMNDPDIGLPYGKIPRILTAHLCTEAKRTGEPIIDLGRSQAQFMERIGLSSSGGKRGDIKRFHEQAKRLFTSTITLTGEPGGQFHWKKINISDAGMLLWNPHDPHTDSQWQSKITLSQPFFEECISHSIPIDLRVLHALRSPLAIDIYVWLTYRYNSVRRPTPITWKQLKWQFGSNYPNSQQGEADFRFNFKKQLRQVCAIYQTAELNVNQDGVTLLPSRPHILP